MTASHELRTPLTAIQGYLELLNSFSEVLNDETKQRFISNARRACEELALLLGNIMDTSRIDQERVALNLSAVRVVEAIQLTLEILEPARAREGRTIEVEIPGTLYVWADDLRLRQILLNVVGNAMKYTPASSKIAISAEYMTWETLCQRASMAKYRPQAPAPGTNFVTIAVRDWGAGILPEDQARLFAKFIRLPGATSSVQRGAGMGLYLCRELAEAMGGSIWVESSGGVDEGTILLIALPHYGEV
jgi:signal transduction histidine kinase